MPLGFLHGLRSKGPAACLPLHVLLALLALATPARAQYVQIDSFEVTPLVGVRFGGTFDLRAEQPPQTQASWKDASSYGLAAGVRFDEFSLIEFRWTRSTSTLRFDAPFVPLGAALGDVTLNQFHADFTREFVIPEVKGLRSFLTGSVGATHVGRCGRWLHPLLVRLRRWIETIPGLQVRDTRRGEMAAHPD